MIDTPHKPMRILPERKRHAAAVEALIAASFGPDRMQKTVYKLRENVKPIRELCTVAIDDKGRLVASLRFWPILINKQWPAVLLGPLAVSPELQRTTWPWEDYTLIKSRVPSELPEKDLFAGIR